jgi:hypothetical protein
VAAGRVDETVARIPSVVSAAVVLTAFTRLVGGLYGLSTGLVAAGMLATMVTWIVAATAARVDMVFSAAIVLALISFLAAYTDGRRGVPQTFYAFSAVAVLAKGPAGLILPAAVVCVYLVCERDWRYFGKLRLRFALPWIALAVAWYVAAYFVGGDAFLQKHLLEENLYRVTSAEAAGVGHTKPFYAHLPLLLAGIAPWTIVVPAAVAGCWRRRREFSKGDPFRFFLVWLVLTFLLFSIAGSKRAVYLLPAYPAVAVILARWWVAGDAAWISRRVDLDDLGWRVTWKSLAVVLAVPSAVLFAQSLGVPVADWLAPVMSEGDRANLTAVVRYLDAHPGGVAIVSGLALAGAALFSVYAAAGRRGAAAAVAIGICAATIMVGSLAIQKEIARSQTVKHFVRGLVVRLHDTPLYSFGRVDYPAVFYAGRPIRRMDDVSEGDERSRFVVLVQGDDVQRVRRGAGELGRNVSEVGRFTFGDNPRRDPLVALLVKREASVLTPTP